MASSGAVKNVVVLLRLQRDFGVHSGQDHSCGIGNIHLGDHGSGCRIHLAGEAGDPSLKVRPSDFTRTSTGWPTRTVGTSDSGTGRLSRSVLIWESGPAASPAIAMRCRPESSSRCWRIAWSQLPAKGAVMRDVVAQRPKTCFFGLGNQRSVLLNAQLGFRGGELASATRSRERTHRLPAAGSGRARALRLPAAGCRRGGRSRCADSARCSSSRAAAISDPVCSTIAAAFETSSRHLRNFELREHLALADMVAQIDLDRSRHSLPPWPSRPLPETAETRPSARSCSRCCRASTRATGTMVTGASSATLACMGVSEREQAAWSADSHGQNAMPVSIAIRRFGLQRNAPIA